jgi:hypothetical protein
MQALIVCFKDILIKMKEGFSVKLHFIRKETGIQSCTIRIADVIDENQAKLKWKNSGNLTISAAI